MFRVTRASVADSSEYPKMAEKARSADAKTTGLEISRSLARPM
jgi:hypothetical protein